MKKLILLVGVLLILIQPLLFSENYKPKNNNRCRGCSRYQARPGVTAIVLTPAPGNADTPGEDLVTSLGKWVGKSITYSKSRLQSSQLWKQCEMFHWNLWHKEKECGGFLSPQQSEERVEGSRAS